MRRRAFSVSQALMQGRKIAKAFRDALAENVRRYEQKFGEIPAPPQGSGSVVH